jgi:hypothetical protein
MNLFYGKIFTTNFLSHSSTKKNPVSFNIFFYNVAHKIAAVKIYAYKKTWQVHLSCFLLRDTFYKIKILIPYIPVHIFPFNN